MIALFVKGMREGEKGNAGVGVNCFSKEILFD